MLIPDLRARRERAVLSQRDLAKRAGVTQATIVAAEHGKPVRIATVRKLARALGVLPTELVAPAAPETPAIVDAKRAATVGQFHAQAARARAEGDESRAADFEAALAALRMPDRLD